MKKTQAEVCRNNRIAKDTFEMILRLEDMPEMIKPGQFAQIAIPGHYLRRPISISSWDEDRITIVYKSVGRGTLAMSGMDPKTVLDVIIPLGNGYATGGSGDRRNATGGSGDNRNATDGSGENRGGRKLLLGGGAGIPPMVGLAKTLVSIDSRPEVILGFGSADEVFYVDEFRDMGLEVKVATLDGSFGEKGLVTDMLAIALDESDPGHQNIEFFACGPEAMLKAIDQVMPESVPGQMSFEERMGCGFGVCMGCSCRTRYGAKRICVDGPVLERKEVRW